MIVADIVVVESLLEVKKKLMALMALIELIERAIQILNYILNEKVKSIIRFKIQSRKSYTSKVDKTGSPGGA